MAAKPTDKKSQGAKARDKGIVPSEKRVRWVKPVAQTVDRLTKRVLGRHGFTHATIVTKWPEIVGDTMARHTQPEKIVFARDGASDGTLHLKTDSSAYALELQHQEPQIVERINTFFGYRAVVRIKLIQGPLPQRHPAARQGKPPRPLSAAESRDLSGVVDTVDDPELKAALERLGENVMGRNAKKD